MNLDNELKDYLSWAYEIGKKDGNGLAEVRKELNELIEAYVTTRVKEELQSIATISKDENASNDTIVNHLNDRIEALTTTTNGKEDS